MNTDKPCDGFEICGNWVPDHEYWCRKCKDRNAQQAELERKAAAYDALQLERNQLAARNARLMAAAKPFADAAESVRSALEPRKDHEDYDNMQAFLDGNRVTPAVEFCGNWRILANVYRESPAASLAEIEARAVERAINAAEGIWSGDIGDEVVLMKDLQDHVNQLRQQAQENE